MAAIGPGLVAAAGPAGAQPAARAVKVGVLRAAPDAPLFRQNFELFRQALLQSGFGQGTNLMIE